MRKLIAAVVLLLTVMMSSGRAQESQELSPYERDLLKYRSFFSYGGFEPRLDEIAPEGYSSRWHASLTADATYTDNVDKDSESRDAFWSGVGLGVGWLGRRPRLEGSFDYRYWTPLYQSENAEDRDLSNHVGAAALRWQAAERLSLWGGAHVTQNFDRSFEAPLPGVRSTYSNRQDEYAANAGYSWQPGRTVTNSGSYAFSYRNYLSDRAEGEDTRRHSASETLGWNVTSGDRLALGYSYDQEETLTTSSGRVTHSANASWGHTLRSFPTTRGSIVSLSDAYETTRDDDGEDYWSNSVSLGYSFSPSPHTDAGMSLGYKLIVPSDGERKNTWIGGANATHRFSPQTVGSASVFRNAQYSTEDNETQITWDYTASLSHRFSPYTTGSLSASSSWDYEPVSTRTDATTLTRTHRVSGLLSSRLQRNLNGAVNAYYVRGDPSGETADGRYWEAGGGGSLTGKVGAQGFWGSDYRLSRRQSQDSDEDYVLQTASLFYRRQLLDWLSGTLRYSHERKDFDPGSAEDSYRENRIYGAATATW